MVHDIPAKNIVLSGENSSRARGQQRRGPGIRLKSNFVTRRLRLWGSDRSGADRPHRRGWVTGGCGLPAARAGLAPCAAACRRAKASAFSRSASKASGSCASSLVAPRARPSTGSCRSRCRSRKAGRDLQCSATLRPKQVAGVSARLSVLLTVTARHVHVQRAARPFSSARRG